MTIFHRHFIIKDTATVLELDAIAVVRNKYIDDLEHIQKEVRADGFRNYVSPTELAGFIFYPEPDKAHWKKSNGLWLPKLKSEIGRALNDRIQNLIKPENVSDVLIKHGLATCFPGSMVEGLTFYSCSVCGSTEKGWFATIPWRDVNPSEIEKNKQDHIAGNSISSNLDHLAWVAPSEWVEIKEWEVRKAMED